MDLIDTLKEAYLLGEPDLGRHIAAELAEFTKTNSVRWHPRKDGFEANIGIYGAIVKNKALVSKDYIVVTFPHAHKDVLFIPGEDIMSILMDAIWESNRTSEQCSEWALGLLKQIKK